LRTDLSFISLLARRAAERLDVVRPGWYRRVDRLTLNMASLYNCVLGQVFGSYVAGVKLLFGARLFEPELLAFNGGFPVELWLAEVDARLAADRDRDRDLALAASAA
jgi:hypothetical protein